MSDGLRRWLMPCLLAGLTGCAGGDDDPADPFGGRVSCASIGGTVTTYDDPACQNCRIDDAASAADGALGSWATISLNQMASGSGPAIRATASEHTPGGNAGAWVHIPEGAQGWTITVRTYLGGTLQESSTLPSPYPTGNPAWDTYAYTTTDLPFDAIEVQVQNANISPADVAFRIYEICSDSSIAGQE